MAGGEMLGPEWTQLRRRGGADVLSPRTARAEAAARGRSKGRGQLAPDRGAVLLAGEVGIWHWYRLEEAGRVGVGRPVLDVVCGPRLHQLAEVHDADTVG
jgi:hypothetical protein